MASWASTALFAFTAVSDRLGIEALEEPATITALVFFVIGFVVWMLAFLHAVQRSRTDEITLGGLFFLTGTAPRPVQIHLLGSLFAAIGVAGATASAAPFGVMEPILPLAFIAQWAARFGVFGPRRTP